MEDWDALEDAQHKRGWVLSLLCTGILFLYLPIGWAFGSARFFPGPQLALKGPWDTLLIYLPLFLFAVYRLLVSPFIRAGFIKPREQLQRLLVPLFLWALPLASFAYWWGDFRGALHAADAVMALSCALVIPLVIFWRTGTVAPLTLGIAVIASTTLFVVDDILGPFQTLWVFASEGPALYGMRTLCAGFALLTACLAPVPMIGKAKNPVSVFRWSMWSLAVVSFGLFLIENAAESPRVFSPELSWVTLGAIGYFVAKTDTFSQRAFALIAGAQLALSTVQLGTDMVLPDGSPLGQVHLLLELSTLVLVGKELKRRYTRRRVRTSKYQGLPYTSDSQPSGHEPQTPAY